ncbi:hypothetical protein [Pseudoalteromonas sp. T1lg76]|uniref:hypothetical protein n=1 Tax=Pseudoalteromonas sp. T1lg76 TaxID=2077103 RepID=UPI001319C4E1|nr:hypothetical protein [Pseudoalteromonas sp. T1lg76]
MTICKKCNSKIFPKAIRSGKSVAYFCPVCGTQQRRFGLNELYILIVFVFHLWAFAFFNYHFNSDNINWSPMMLGLAGVSVCAFLTVFFSFFKIITKRGGNWKIINIMSFSVFAGTIILAASQVWGL